MAHYFLYEVNKLLTMKNWISFPIVFLALAMILSGCEVVGGIFKAGVWVGLLVAALVIGLIIYFMTRRK
jgi:uncharacterized protein (DUF2062 family)